MKVATLLFMALPVISLAQAPPGYYDGATGLTGFTLKSALETIIDDIDDSNGQPFHDISVTYGQLWALYETSDVRPDGKVWEMYSDCDFTFIVDQDDGTGGGTECDKFNREHSFPRSWFDDNSAHPIFNDPFHVIPSDKKVNAERGNLAYGEVGSVSYTSLNGSQRGTSSIAGPTGEVFEPIDQYKGDIARGFFYIATRYQDDIAGWEAFDTDGDSMLDGSSDKVFEQWALDMLYSWHVLDPVSQKEMDRNEAIFNHQDNRNPFIDNPQYVLDVWQSTLSDPGFALNTPRIYPNPIESDRLFVNSTVQLSMEIYDLLGQLVERYNLAPGQQSVYVGDLPAGLFIVRLYNEQLNFTQKIIRR